MPMMSKYVNVPSSNSSAGNEDDGDAATAANCCCCWSWWKSAPLSNAEEEANAVEEFNDGNNCDCCGDGSIVPLWLRTVRFKTCFCSENKFNSTISAPDNGRRGRTNLVDGGGGGGEGDDNDDVVDVGVVVVVVVPDVASIVVEMRKMLCSCSCFG